MTYAFVWVRACESPRLFKFADRVAARAALDPLDDSRIGAVVFDDATDLYRRTGVFARTRFHLALTGERPAVGRPGVDMLFEAVERAAQNTPVITRLPEYPYDVKGEVVWRKRREPKGKRK